MSLQPVMLQSDKLSVGLAPDTGGSLAWLRWQGDDLLRPMTVSDNRDIDPVRLTAAYPLVPYSNRIANARFSWAGKHHRLQKNFGNHPHCIHGFGWQRSWHLTQIDKQSALVQLEHEADHDWPWNCGVTQRIHLNDNSVSIEITLTNHDTTPMPAGLGWHPYFLKTQQMTLQFNAHSFWLMDEVCLPSRAVDLPGHADFSQARLIGNPELDNCYEGWTGKAVIDIPEKKVRICMLSPKSQYLVVFTPEDKNFVAIEPVTHLNNAIHFSNPESKGIHSLSPNEQIVLGIKLVIEPLEGVIE